MLRRTEEGQKGQFTAVLSRKNHTMHGLFALLFSAFLVMSCSSADPVQPDADRTEAAEVDSPGPDTESVDAGPTPDESASGVSEPTLSDQNLASLLDLGSGEQVEDAQGNLLAVYGVVEWSESFDALTDEAQASFPFFGDVEALADPDVSLVALDVGMCSAGIDTAGFGTAEFFVHDSPDEMLSTDQTQDRGVLARHPVLQPGFDFPRAAECTRGWLPVFWSTSEPPTVARYVLTTRASADADVERHVYQWDLESIDQPAEPDLADFDLFGIGQTVTFNQGTLEGTTVVVAGWAELISANAPVEGTRVVGLSLTYCPSSLRLPEFGLAVDGWNLIAPAPDSDLLGARSVADPTQSCFDGWLEFAVPFGGVPTGFFASDGTSSTIGYAEWSLEQAALPAPS